MSIRTGPGYGVTAALVVLLVNAVAAPALAATNVAVFNFQMKSETPDWRWLEKGLADRIATDFVQDRGLSVVARDEMQLVAQKMNWVPEMATTDAGRMNRLELQLMIEYLATGVFSVSGDEIAITGQIVEVKGRAELFRKEVKGKAADVLELQRRLSADLLSWFSKKEPAQILATLPVWTRSLPAARALYEGMDLYDRGRYGEAWLRFRQASRDDPQYVEAVYWVGKMYYFLNRYEHARRSLERFVYMDMTHPRLGDAMVEYVHTYENSGASAEALLQMYENLGRRFPNAEVREGGMWGNFGKIEADEWFKYKSAQLLAQIGRHKEAALMTRPALSSEGQVWKDPAANICIDNVLYHHMLTGETFGIDVMLDAEWNPRLEMFLSFGPEAHPLVYSLVQPRRILGLERKDLDKQAIFDPQSVTIPLLLVAPSGYVFQSCRFYPLTEGEDGRMEVAIYLPGTYYSDKIDFEPPRSEDLAVACREGVLWKNLPRIGLLLARCRISVKSPQSGPVVVTGVRVKPTLSRIANPGAIDVRCQDTFRFHVYVDGAFARWYPGLVGPLSPGEHTVRLSPAEPGTPYGDWETKVVVEAGKVTPLVGRLPWQADSPWSSWKTSCVGTDYPGYDLRLHKQDGSPAIQADEDAIHLVWGYRGDLWSSVSADGETFSPPCKLDLPVSSGWLEYAPRLLRDQSGRFILSFLSDRDARHRYLPYICWSRDLVHWSAPALVFDESVRSYEIVRDERDKLIWVGMGAYKGVKVWVSRDGHLWDQVVSLNPADKGNVWEAEILQSADGQFELFTSETAEAREKVGNVLQTRYTPLIVRRVSPDAMTWGDPKRLAEFESPDGGFHYWRLSAASGKDGPVLLTQLYRSVQHGARMSAFGQDKAGVWSKLSEYPSLISGNPSCAFHPRWGYLIAFLAGKGHEWWRHDDSGPYLMRGPDLGPLRALQPSLALLPTEPNQPPDRKSSKTEIGDESGRVVRTTVQDRAPEAEETVPKSPFSADAPVGHLFYGPAFADDTPFYRFVRLEGEQHFKKPAPNSGTVNPNALVVTVDRGGATLAIALDSEAPQAAHFDVLRIDTSGKGDFHGAAVVPRAYVTTIGEGRFKYGFKKQLELAFGQRKVLAGVKVVYLEKPTSRGIEMNFGTCGEGRCQFGDKIHIVRLFDTNCNLRVNDAVRLSSDNVVLPEDGQADYLYVDMDGNKSQYHAQGFYGQLLLVDGRLWQISTSDDGTKVTAEPYDGPTGNVKIDHPFWKAWFLGKRSQIMLYGGPEPVPIPAGSYKMVWYCEWSSASPEKATSELGFTESSPTEGMALEIAPGRTENVAIGSPLKGHLTVTPQGGVLHFHVTVADATGKPGLWFYGPRHTHWNPVVAFNLSDSSGKQVATFRKDLFTAGEDGWQIPLGFRGKFTATVEFPSDTFRVDCEPVTFTIEG